jgi:hypothetical protein
MRKLVRFWKASGRKRYSREAIAGRIRPGKFDELAEFYGAGYNWSEPNSGRRQVIRSPSVKSLCLFLFLLFQRLHTRIPRVSILLSWITFSARFSVRFMTNGGRAIAVDKIVSWEDYENGGDGDPDVPQCWSWTREAGKRVSITMELC